jgi:hypothetical protein
MTLSPGALRYSLSGTGRIDFYGSSLGTTGQFLTAGGNPKIVILSACTFSGNQAATSSLSVAIDFSASTNVVTIGNLNIGSARWTYYSGTVTASTGTRVAVIGTTGNFDTSNIIFNDLYIPLSTPAATHNTTLFSDLNVRGDFYCNGGIRNVIFSGDTNTSINLSGSCFLGGLTGGAFGTNGPTFRFKGTGTLSNPNSPTISANISIETGANTFSLVGDLLYVQGGGLPKPTFIYTSGILNLTGHSVIVVSTANLNLGGVTMKQVTFINGTTTLQSRLSCESVVITISSADSTIDGSGGFTTGSFNYIMQANRLLTLQNSVEYIVNNSLLIRGTNTTSARLSSNSLTRTFFTLRESATQDVGFVNTTRIDSSSGQTIYTRNGTLSDTINWRFLQNPVTVSKSFLLQ